MRKLLFFAALLLGLASPCFAQEATVVVPPPACTAFGTTSGTCLQGAGNAGTPSALVGTNISGTAAALTAGSVTTSVSSWTPIDSSGAGLTFTSVVATYIQINRLVCFWATFTIPVTVSGTLAIVGGLPVAINTSTALPLFKGEFIGVGADIPVRGISNTTTMGIYANTGAGLAWSALSTQLSYITGCYSTN